MEANASIAGIGTWLPPRVRRNDEFLLARVERTEASGDRTFNDIPASTDERAAAIVARDLEREAGDPYLGGKRRRVAEDETTAAEAETYAARAALDDAGIPASEIDVILSYPLVPDRPGSFVAPKIQHALGATRAFAMMVDTACATSVAQLAIAASMIEADRARVVLITMSHLMLRTFPLDHPAVPGLGDGAGAFVVCRGGGLAIKTCFAVTHGEFADAVVFRRGPEVEADTPWWQPGGGMRLGSRDHAQAKYLMRETVSYGAQTVRQAADKAGIAVGDIDAIASVHPRGFVPGAIAEHLGLSRDIAPTTYEETGHLGGVGVAFNLSRIRSRYLLKPGGYAAIYAQGAGFTRASTILQVVPGGPDVGF